ncbi:MAG: adenylyltransferase/cytidyltransferase family protein [bacterium]|nr:adenylyltransferase/cytidyltransferase family protein [bacterium]
MSADLDFAPILTLDEFAAIRDSEDLGTVVATSGGYDPIHPGHISCVLASRPLGDTLVVVVNGDAFLSDKKGRPFQDLATRCAIVAAIRGVDYVIAFEIENDPTVGVALDVIRPKYFTKGGDRVPGNMPESEERACQDHGIEIKYGVGLDKQWSSSNFLADWGRFWATRGS